MELRPGADVVTSLGVFALTGDHTDQIGCQLEQSDRPHIRVGAPVTVGRSRSVRAVDRVAVDGRAAEPSLGA